MSKAKLPDVKDVANICIGRSLALFRERNTECEQWEMGEVLGVEQTTYSKYERGRIGLPAGALLVLPDKLAVPGDIVLWAAKLLYDTIVVTPGEVPGWVTSTNMLISWCDDALRNLALNELAPYAQNKAEDEE